MKIFFRQPFSPGARLLILAGLGFGFGLLMTQSEIAARRLGLFVHEIEFVHQPAYFIAEILHDISHGLDDLLGPLLQVEKPAVNPPPNGLAVDFGALKCIPFGIVVEWTLLGALAGMAWNVWIFAARRRQFRCDVVKALRIRVGPGFNRKTRT